MLGEKKPKIPHVLASKGSYKISKIIYLYYRGLNSLQLLSLSQGLPHYFLKLVPWEDYLTYKEANTQFWKQKANKEKLKIIQIKINNSWYMSNSLKFSILAKY